MCRVYKSVCLCVCVWIFNVVAAFSVEFWLVVNRRRTTISNSQCLYNACCLEI